MTSVASVPPRSRALRRGYFLAVVAAAGLAGGALVLKAVVPHGHAAQAPSIRTVDGAITGAEVAGSSLTITAELRNAPDLASNVDLAGMAARAVGKQLRAGVAENVSGVSTVELVFTAAPLGPLMVVDLRLADLKAADYDALQWPGVLDLATGVKVAEAGRPAVAAWCAKPDRVAPAFCAKALD